MAKNLHRQRTPMSEQLRLITECRQSGLTDADWCRENGVNPSTFYSWLARCRKSACSAQIPPAGYGHSARPEPRQDVVAIGEVGLNGEVRSVNMIEKRIKEVEKMGFKKCIIPESNKKVLKENFKLDIIGVSDIREAMKNLGL